MMQRSFPAPLYHRFVHVSFLILPVSSCILLLLRRELLVPFSCSSVFHLSLLGGRERSLRGKSFSHRNDDLAVSPPPPPPEVSSLTETNFDRVICIFPASARFYLVSYKHSVDPSSWRGLSKLHYDEGSKRWPLIFSQRE